MAAQGRRHPRPLRCVQTLNSSENRRPSLILPLFRTFHFLAGFRLRRGLYGGSVLYLDFSGNLNSCIVIRTVLIKDRKAYLQAGAGIVADSVPALEYQECVNKAKAVLKAFELAEKGL